MQTADDGTFRRVNRLFCEWVGYDEHELVGVRTLQDLLTMGGRIFHQTHWAPLLQMQGSISEIKLQVEHREGPTIPMVLNAVRRRVGNIWVHELSDLQRQTVARIGRATRRATTLVADLLDFTQARIGDGLSITREDIDIHAVLAACVNDLRSTYPHRKLEHARNGQGTCSADASRLEQVTGNLVANAVAYGDPQAPVTITSSVQDVSCSIAVHNLGTPIDAEQQATIFVPMTRGAEAPKASRGVGLGLYIVYEITRSYGGTATVASTAERGTTFTMTFPRRAPTT